MSPLTAFALVVAVVLTVGLIWRYAYFCPSWLAPLLENPYVDAVAGPDVLLGRAGVQPGMTVLDAGCGPGRLTIPAARRVGVSGRVVAVDIQMAMLEKLRSRARRLGVANVHPVLAGLGEGALPAGECDVALLVTVLGEVPDKAAALRDIHRALRPGGVLSITEVLPDPHYQPMRRVHELTALAGFREQQTFSGLLSYTINFVRVDSSN